MSVQLPDVLNIFVCPICKGRLDLHVGHMKDDVVETGNLSCAGCKKSFSIDASVPVFINDEVEMNREGVAVRLESAIALFREEIDPESNRSGRLFDNDLDDKDAVFLDIGCGIGRHLLALKNNNILNTFGFDIVRDLLWIARNEFNLKNVFAANALYIPLPNNFADKCFLYNVIEHCSEPEGVLSEIHRVLARDGILYMDCPNAKSVGDRIFRWGGRIVYGQTSHIQKFSRNKIEALVNRTGFQILESRVQRGIFIDYPQLRKFTLIKKILKTLYGNDVAGWELKLRKVG